VEEGVGPDGELRTQAHDQQQGGIALSPAVSYSISMPLAFARVTLLQFALSWTLVARDKAVIPSAARDLCWNSKGPSLRSG